VHHLSPKRPESAPSFCVMCYKVQRLQPRSQTKSDGVQVSDPFSSFRYFISELAVSEIQHPALKLLSKGEKITQENMSRQCHQVILIRTKALTVHLHSKAVK
jgi:hypothetical protein